MYIFQSRRLNSNHSTVYIYVNTFTLNFICATWTKKVRVRIINLPTIQVYKTIIEAVELVHQVMTYCSNIFQFK